MSDSKPVLCGGTFFSLMLQARKGTSPSNISCFNSLMRIIDSTHIDIQDGSKRIVSEFKNCELKGNTSYISFGDDGIIREFEKRIRDDYTTVMDEFSSFIDSVIKHDSNRRWFIGALYELIESDDSIPGDAKLFINKGFIPSYKKELTQDRCLSYYNFILGIWFYIFSRPMNESKGKKTIESWTDGNVEKGATHKFVSEIGIKLKDKISFDYNYSDDENNTENSAQENMNQIDVTLLSSESVVEEYLSGAYSTRSQIVTFLYNSEESFYNVFVCSNIAYHHTGYAGEVLRRDYSPDEIIEDINITKFSPHRNRVMIIGTAGLGKTMLMNHLFLDAIDHFDVYNKVPVFVTLRDYEPQEKSLIDFIFSEFSRYNNKLQLQDLVYLLSIGCAVLLLDGLDEITGEDRVKFEKELSRIIDSYPRTLVIVSMRPGESNLFTGRFKKYDLLPLSIDQATALISKLDDQYIGEKTKKQFLSDLDTDRFSLTKDEKRIFLGIPLFLCITILTYRTYYDIPKKRNEFYKKAYDAVCEGHDRIKELRRGFYTGLTPGEFEIFFAEFCANTYVSSKSSFDERELKFFVEDTISLNNYKFSFDDFLRDVTERVCLMILDAKKYYFVHKSFQEYFAAYFFTKQPEDTFDVIFNNFLLDKDHHNSGDITIEMMYGLDKYKTEKYVFIPYLKLSCCDKEDYFGFLRRNYDQIKYTYSERAPVLSSNNLPDSSILMTICEVNDIVCSVLLNRLIDPKNPFVFSRPFYLVENEETKMTEIVSYEDMSDNAKEMYGKYEPDGYDCVIKMADIQESCTLQGKVFEEDFPIKILYRKLQVLYKELVIKYEKQGEPANTFSIFHR